MYTPDILINFLSELESIPATVERTALGKIENDQHSEEDWMLLLMTDLKI
uniref:Uncharacterized protein n=1 Tax=Arion vulgaris TaxID=1028688 RepID=A0A0B7AEE6_9EUPU